MPMINTNARDTFVMLIAALRMDYLRLMLWPRHF
jgi:hypothetical protein